MSLSLTLVRTALASLAVAWGLYASPACAQRSQDNADARALRETLAHRARPRRWRSIVLHHSATPGGSPEAFEAWHRGHRRFAYGMAYHFVIGNGRGMPDGRIEAGPRWRLQQQGAHVAARLRDARGASVADAAIGVCLVGNFERERPTRAQLASLRRLLRALQRRYAIAPSAVRGHCDVHPGHTACPGRALRDWQRQG
ncbi:MAG: N-acetylmuramoyl-L-alanine amidase [Myxococcales bacterium]|nr:N-acetylmuramoyl-L-alanine amidase [Myxococcales bacterium]